ncbi:NAD(P)/FAD-dependent oxidoreductase [Patescibacteria group bacterium]|nr:NAD(P)/FAD-dependent oxidoreductase [Patescibacteria group bacterium]
MPAKQRTTTKRPKTTFDVIVIGSGSAGFSAAETARSLGASVCIIEKNRWGGECPNYACVPTKALLKSAKLYHTAKRELASYGINAKSVTYNFSRMMQRKDAVVSAITGDGKRLEKLASQFGITTIKGSAKFTGPHEVRVGSRRLTGKTIVIATGTYDFVPPIDGLEKAGFIGFKEAVSLKSMPSSIAIVGGGPVGCEFATFFGLLGARVTILQLDHHILPQLGTPRGKNNFRLGGPPPRRPEIGSGG